MSGGRDPRLSFASEAVQQAHLGPELGDWWSFDPRHAPTTAVWLGALEWEAATDAFNPAQFEELFG